MNMDFKRQAIRNLSTQGLYALVEDCTYRIGSHSLSDDPNEEYLNQQKAIVQMVQEELVSRQ